MRNVLLGVVAAIIVAGFVLFMTTYTVRFTDAAVVTTFGKAGEDSVILEPGLEFKLPAPIQNVTVYDTRARFLERVPEQQTTADQRPVVVGGFLTWRVSDPRTFYQRFRQEAGPGAAEQYIEAEKTLRELFRSAMSEVSRFRFNELLAAGPEASRLDDLEAAILRRLEAPSEEGGGEVSSYGIAIGLVGINELMVPQDVTEQIFEAMRGERATISSALQAEGEAEAASLRAQAESQAQRIEAFANVQAGQQRARGERAAAPLYAAQAGAPELAEFLAQLELIRDGLGRRATLILPTTMFGTRLFDPGALEKIEAIGREQQTPQNSDADDEEGSE